jgi:hypothetical protein
LIGALCRNLVRYIDVHAYQEQQVKLLVGPQVC